MLYAALIENHLNKRKVIITDSKREYTYMQIHREAMGILAYLHRQGLARGDRVLIRNYNDGRTAAAVLACLADGIIFVLVSNHCGKKELQYMIDDCSAFMFLDLQDVQDTEDGEIVDERGLKNQVSEDAGAYILYTSGTEGIRKGVLACQRQITFCCNSILSRLKYKESDRVLCSLPLEFDYGLYQIFLSLLSESALFLAETSLIQMIPHWLHEWRITIFPSLPSVVNLLLRLNCLSQEQLPCLRKITFTGEYLSVELIKDLAKVLPSTMVIPMYGITECKRVAVMPEGREDKVMAGSCGLPLDGINVYLDKKASDEEGELIVEGPNVMEGYWNRASDRFGVNPESGMKTYRTGDLMSMDEEGFLYFRGRSNGFMKVRGYRISEIEIERIVQETKGVIECAAAGIPDKFCNEKIGIWVYTQSEMMIKRISEILTQSISYSISYSIFLTDAPLPRNVNGKIDKSQLKRMVHGKDGYISGK